MRKSFLLFALIILCFQNCISQTMGIASVIIKALQEQQQMLEQLQERTAKVAAIK